MYHEGVDFTAPLEAVFPGASAAVLAVLARAERPMTLRQIGDRAGVSHPQVARHVERFQMLGLVRREVVGRSHHVQLVDGAVGSLVRRLGRVDELVIDRMRATAARLEPNTMSIVVFGSFARGAAGPESDIDVAIVAADPELPVWLEEVSGWVEEMAEYSGSPVAEIVVSLHELAERSDEALWQAISAEGIVVAGRSIAELVSGTEVVRIP